MKSSQSATIIFEGKCENIENIIAPELEDAEYNYSGTLNHAVTPFVTVPEGCGPIIY